MKKLVISVPFIALIFILPMFGVSQGDALISTSSGDEYMVILSKNEDAKADCYALKMQRGVALFYEDSEKGSVYTPDTSIPPMRVGSALSEEECISKAARKLS